MYSVCNLTNLVVRLLPSLNPRANTLALIFGLFRASSITSLLTPISFLDITSGFSKEMVFVALDSITEGTTKSSLHAMKGRSVYNKQY